METYYQFTLSDDFGSCQIDIKLTILASNSHDPLFLRYNLEIPLNLVLTVLPVPYPYPFSVPTPNSEVSLLSQQLQPGAPVPCYFLSYCLTS